MADEKIAKPVGPHPRSIGVHCGDEVYYKHPRLGPVSGKVLCSGEHGCTIEAGKQRHKVKWDNLIAHKKRTPQSYSVLDDGEDGLVVADAKGKRRFIGTVPDQAPERVIMKAMPK